MKFAKRKLRLQRCKTIPGSKLSENSNATPKTAPTSKRARKDIVVPRGDPQLGEKLAHLSKDERKKAKASDPDRVQRRLAKKRAREAVSAAKVRGTTGKERHRERKSSGSRKSSKKPHKRT